MDSNSSIDTMIRFPLMLMILAAFLALSGMHGAEAGESGSLLDIPSDPVAINVDLNISNPLDDVVVVNVSETIDENSETIDDKVEDIKESLSFPLNPNGSDNPENITFAKDHTGISEISRGASTGIRSSPGILSDGIGLGLTRVDDTVPEDARKSGTACTSILYSLVGGGAGKLISKLPAQQPSEPGNVKVSSNQFVAATMVGVIIMAFASVVSSRSPTEKALPLLVPMYSRISRDEVLENETRGDIYRLIAHSPGMDLLSIKNALGLSNGVLAHHIHTLERERYLRSVRDGRYRRFFVSGTKVELANSMEQEILKEVEACPSINQCQIAKNLGISRQALNYHIRKLIRNGSIVTERVGRETQCRRRDS